MHITLRRPSDEPAAAFKSRVLSACDVEAGVIPVFSPDGEEVEVYGPDTPEGRSALTMMKMKG